MPHLGKRFSANGDMRGYWDLNEAGADFTIGLTSKGGIVLRNAPEPHPPVGRYPLPSSSTPIPSLRPSANVSSAVSLSAAWASTRWMASSVSSVASSTSISTERTVRSLRKLRDDDGNGSLVRPAASMSAKGHRPCTRWVALASANSNRAVLLMPVAKSTATPVCSSPMLPRCRPRPERRRRRLSDHGLKTWLSA